MNRTLIYFALAGIAIILQTVLLPLVITGDYKPDLLLILVVYLGLHEGPWSGGALVYLLSLIHISEPTRLVHSSRMPSSA